MFITHKVGLSTCGKKDISENGLKFLKKSGIDCIEISSGFDDFARTDFKKLVSNARKCDMEIWSMHIPFTPFTAIDISSLDENIRKSTVMYFSCLIRTAGENGIGIVVIHPSAEPILDASRGARMAASKKSLAELAVTAKKHMVKIAVENLPRSCLGNSSAEIIELISADESLRVCFDTNHLLGEKITDFIENVGGKICTVHVSDYDFVNERHWLPGEGDIDWNELLSALDRTGYDGAFMYEVSYSTPKTIFRERDLAAPDFKRNYLELVSSQKPVTFCKRKEL